jgi:DNA-binding MarR family transcriptional regulator
MTLKALLSPSKINCLVLGMNVLGQFSVTAYFQLHRGRRMSSDFGQARYGMAVQGSSFSATARIALGVESLCRFVGDAMSYKSWKGIHGTCLETFRFNGRLLTEGDRLTKPFELSSARWQVLGAIVEEPLSVAQIARNMGVARQSVQRLADKLERMGIVEYTPNPDHGRAKLVRLIEEGYRVMKALTRIQIRWGNEIASDVSSDEITSALT